jgi:hypothetical protein
MPELYSGVGITLTEVGGDLTVSAEYIKDLGAIADGVNSAQSIVRSFSGVGSSSGLYGRNEQVRAYGSGALGSVRVAYYGANIDTSAGTTDLVEAAHFYGWVKNNGNVGVVKVVEAHIRAGSDDNGVNKSGTILTEGIFYNTAGITLGTTITIPKITGYNAGALTSGTQIVKGYGFSCEHNQSTASGGEFAGFRSQVRAATNSWSFLANTNDGSDAAIAGLSGKVSIGNATPGTAFVPTWQLDVLGNATDFAAAIRNRSGASPWGLRLEFTAAAPNSTATSFLRCQDNAAVRMHIYSNGNLVNANNSYGAISDKKLKTDIRDAGSQLDDIRALKIRKYRMKADGPEGHEHIGVIAQEAAKVSPGLVFETPDMETVIGEDGEEIMQPNGETTLGVHYSVLYMKAVKALQELAAVVEKQGHMIEALQGR